MKSDSRFVEYVHQKEGGNIFFRMKSVRVVCDTVSKVKKIFCFINNYKTPITIFCHFINFRFNMIILLILNRIFISIYIDVNFSLKQLFARSTSFNDI